MKNMRKLFYLMATCVMLVCISCKGSNEESRDDFELIRGVNISHWLSQSNVRGEARAAYFPPTFIKRLLCLCIRKQRPGFRIKMM